MSSSYHTLHATDDRAYKPCISVSFVPLIRVVWDLKCFTHPVKLYCWNQSSSVLSVILFFFKHVKRENVCALHYIDILCYCLVNLIYVLFCLVKCFWSVTHWKCIKIWALQNYLIYKTEGSHILSTADCFFLKIVSQNKLSEKSVWCLPMLRVVLGSIFSYATPYSNSCLFLRYDGISC